MKPSQILELVSVESLVEKFENLLPGGYKISRYERQHICPKERLDSKLRVYFFRSAFNVLFPDFLKLGLRHCNCDCLAFLVVIWPSCPSGHLHVVQDRNP